MCDENGFVICVQCLVCKHFLDCKEFEALAYCSDCDCNGCCCLSKSAIYCGCFEEDDLDLSEDDLFES